MTWGNGVMFFDQPLNNMVAPIQNNKLACHSKLTIGDALEVCGVDTIQSRSLIFERMRIVVN